MWGWMKAAGPWLWAGFKAVMKWLLTHPAAGIAIAVATAGAGAYVQVAYSDVPALNALGAGMQYAGAIIGAVALNGLWWDIAGDILEDIVVPAVTPYVAPWTQWVYKWIIAPTAAPGVYLPR